MTPPGEGTAPPTPDLARAVGGTLADLLPGSHQDRSRTTVLVVLAAAVDLLDEVGDDGFCVEALRRRSGVTTGSLYHHFGDLDRVRDLAHALRSERGLEGPVIAAVERYRGADSGEDLARITRTQVVGRDRPEARTHMRALTAAIAAAREREDLRRCISDLFRRNLDRLEAVFATHHAAGRLPGDVHPRALILLSRALAHVRLLDDLDPRPVPHRDWVTVACRIHDGLVGVGSQPSGPPIPPDRRRELGATLVAATLADRTDEGGDPRVRRLIAHARDLVLADGPGAVEVGRLRAQQGLSAGWFHRRFGDRDGLLDAVRLDVLERTLRAEVRSFAALVARVRTPDELAGAVAAWVVEPDDETARRLRWQRAELLVAAQQRAGLGHEAGLAIAAATDRLVSVIVAAQGRGLVRPELAPRAVARAVQAVVFGPLLAEIDGTDIPVAAWEATALRAFASLTA